MARRVEPMSFGQIRNRMAVPALERRLLVAFVLWLAVPIVHTPVPCYPESRTRAM